MITGKEFGEYDVKIVQSSGDCLTKEYVEMFVQNTAQVRVLYGGPCDGEQHVIPAEPAHTQRVDFVIDAKWNGETAKYAIYKWNKEEGRYDFQEIAEEIYEGQKYYF
jgi:hypothetical protein